MEVRASAEDYLEAILLLQRRMGVVRSVDVAQHLEVSKPSVCHAVASLRAKGFLRMDERRFLILTEAGRSVAEITLEKHQFFSAMLMEAGVDPKTAEKEACRSEHAISTESFERLIAIHAISKGNGRTSSRLSSTAAPEIIKKIISFLMPPNSNNDSSLLTSTFMIVPLFHTVGGICILYPWGYILSRNKAAFRLPHLVLTHVGKSFYSFCKTFDCFIRIPVLNAIPDTVANMPLQNHLSASVKRRFGSIDLSKNILTGDIFIYHSVNRLNLTNDFLESAVQIIRIHALSHNSRLHTIRGICKVYRTCSVLSICSWIGRGIKSDWFHTHKSGKAT